MDKHETENDNQRTNKSQKDSKPGNTISYVHYHNNSNKSTSKRLATARS